MGEALGRRAPLLVPLPPAHPGLAPVVGLLAPPAELPGRLLLFLALAHDPARPPANRWSCSARVGGAMSSVTSHCATTAASASSARPARARAAASRRFVARVSRPTTWAAAAIERSRMSMSTL